MKLFVVMTNLPGPGARAVMTQTIDRLVREGHEGGFKHPLGDALDAGVCEFIDLEDDEGHGHGSIDTGVDWDSHPNGEALKRLGPFAPYGEAERLRAALRAIADHEEHFVSGPPDDEMREIARAALAEESR